MDLQELQKRVESSIPALQNEDSIYDTLNGVGATVESAARTVGDIMHFGNKDTTRLKAAEMVLQLHGVLDEEEKAPSIVFNVLGGDVQIANILNPTR